MIHLEKVELKDKELLFNINQKYLYEMTNYYDDLIDIKGILHYGYFDEYFKDSKRLALFIYNDNDLVGFLMLHPYSYFNKEVDYVLAEFTIFPMYRRKGFASEVVSILFNKYKGDWEIKYNEKNIPAKSFWNKMTFKYNPIKTNINEFETILTFNNNQEE